MHLNAFSAAMLMLATLTQAVPTEPLSSDVDDMPDGLYVAEHNADRTDNTIIKFTPLEDILEVRTTSPVAAAEVSGLQARSAATTCEGVTLDRSELVSAWKCLMNAVGDGGFFPGNTYSYVSLETSSFLFPAKSLFKETLPNILQARNLMLQVLYSVRKDTQSPITATMQIRGSPL
jgi:hypothetical protein